MATTVVGISAFFHDAACCVLRDGVLRNAAEEERFTRVKHDPRMPVHAFRWCLADAGVRIHDIDCIAYYETPAKKLARQLWMYLQPGAAELARRNICATLDIGRVEREIRELLGYEGRIEFVDHHLSHAASAFCFSGFDEAAVLTVDGVGEWATTTCGRASGTDIELMEEVHFPHSLGLLYATITAYLGFEVNEGEYKVMGLAPYGEPRYVDQIRGLIRSEDGFGYQLDMRYFDFVRGERMASDALAALLGHPPREPESAIEPFHTHVARSLQVVLEEVLLDKVAYLHRRVPSPNLCMAGGVALNCVANSRILKDGPFSRLFVQPAASDAGGALGAAAVAHARLTGERVRASRLEHVFLGPRFSNDDVRQILAATSTRYHDFDGRLDELLSAVVDRLTAGRVVAWFQGAMEFGPRALGARSIVADPRRPDMRDRINALVKYRESFRPFAPSVLLEDAAAHFDLDHPSPFMLETCQVRSPLSLPAITHADGSARVQTVDPGTAPRYAALLEAFRERTGCPVLLNTSFNRRGEPIVHTPDDALVCFVRSHLDSLVIEDVVIDREDIGAAWQALAMLPAAFVEASGVSRTVYTLL